MQSKGGSIGKQPDDIFLNRGCYYNTFMPEVIRSVFDPVMIQSKILCYELAQIFKGMNAINGLHLVLLQVFQVAV